MLYDLNEIRGYDIAALDGSLGKAADFYFDDRSWRIRYLVVDTGWLFGRNVLIAPDAIRSVVPSKTEISLSLTKNQIEAAPGIDSDLPVSKQEETTLRGYYGWHPYWDLYPVGMGPLIPPQEVERREAASMPGRSTVQTVEEEVEHGDHHLRSAREVDGYHIAARDGEIGHVDDFIIDQETWLIRYLVVDTRNWLPGRKVLVGPSWATGIDWGEHVVSVDLTREAVRESPEYDPEKPIDRQYETVLHTHLDRAGYWE